MSQTQENVTSKANFGFSGNRFSEHNATEISGLPRSILSNPNIQCWPKPGDHLSNRSAAGPVQFSNPYHLDEFYYHPQRRASFAPAYEHPWSDMTPQAASQQDFRHQYRLERGFQPAAEWDGTVPAYGVHSRPRPMKLETIATPSYLHGLQSHEYEFSEGHETETPAPIHPEHPQYATELRRHETRYETGHTASGRKPRSHIWPALSDVPPRIHFPRGFESKTIIKGGRNSGRNLLANFVGSDGTPRTRYNLRVLSGRGASYLPHVQRYPACDTQIPAYLTLEEICEQYPRHVWGTGLRMFIAEGWTGEKIYNTLPEDFRDSKAVQRPWNYIQQGFTREVSRMNEEDGLSSKIGKKRKREDSMDDEEDFFDVFQRQPRRYRISDAAQPAQSWNLRPGRSSHTVSSNQRPRQHSRTPSPLPDIMESSAPVDEDLAAELFKHEILLLAILKAYRPDLCSEPLDNQMERVNSAHAELFIMCGIESEDANLEELMSFGERLKEVVENLQSEMIPESH